MYSSSSIAVHAALLGDLRVHVLCYVTMVQTEAQLKPRSGKVHLHKGFVERWETICGGAYFEKMRVALRGAERAVITGHSLGGAVAILATLWYLQNRCARCVWCTQP